MAEPIKDDPAAADGGDIVTGALRGDTQDPWANMDKQQGEVQQELRKQATEAAKLLPISKELQEFIAKEREDIQKYHSYATAIFARNGGKAVEKEDIAAEFRAREIFLAMLDRLEDKISSRTITLEAKIKEDAKAKDIAKKRNEQ